MSETAKFQLVVAELVVQSARHIADGKPTLDIVADLEKRGCPLELAQGIVRRGVEMKQAEFRKRGREMMLIGAGLCGAGILISFIFYSMASPGGHYIVTVGLIAGGAWTFLKGSWKAAAG